jgi:hypothetical protein
MQELKEIQMRKYQFIVGVSLSALEEEVNRVVNDEQSAKLNQVFYAQGTGFVGVIERPECNEVLQIEQKVQPAKARANQTRSRNKS